MTDSARATGAVALVTCAEYADGHVDDIPIVGVLADLGISASFVVWDDPAVAWDDFDVVILRSTWDYPPRRDQFLAWAETVPALLNPLDAVRWSSDKRYFRELTAGGAPCIPSSFAEPGDAAERIGDLIDEAAASAPQFVVKPSVGAGSVDAGRFESDDPGAVALACKHAAALLDSGRAAMIQPYLDGVDVAGESALIFMNGEFSHAVRKEPMLAGGLTQFDGLFGDERTSPMTPSAAERAAADAVLDATPFGRTDLLYARVDLLPGPGGHPLLLELELVEPSLFMADVPGATVRFATAIAMHLP